MMFTQRSILNRDSTDDGKSIPGVKGEGWGVEG